jgi:ubiquinone/menaquinone biosynthesis C-methylase UbiE
MGLYARFVLPALIDVAMRQRPIEEYRRHVVPAARGRVLEIGVGSGLNLPLYGEGAEIVFAIDPSRPLLRKAVRRMGEARVPLDLREGSAMEIPFADQSFDTVVMTWTLCSIAEPERALREVRRVLKPAGALLFVEHGLSPDPRVARWQACLTPLWRPLTGGCHLDRKIDGLIAGNGFRIAALKNFYAEGPRPLTYFYEGRAEPVSG